MRKLETWLTSALTVANLVKLLLGVLLGAVAEQNGLLPSGQPGQRSELSSKSLDCPQVQQPRLSPSALKRNA